MYDYKGFMNDFMIANHFGEKAIRDTYKRAFNEWKDNVEYFSSLVLTLNHLIWAYYEKDEKLAKVYNELWENADRFGSNHFKGDDATYYFNFLDQLLTYHKSFDIIQA